MRIIERLRSGHPVFSFEFYPPKTDAGVQSLWNALADLRSLHPDFVSVTYGAGGSTRVKTVDITTRIKRELGIEAMAHLTCVGATREDLRTTLDALKQGGIENVLPLRGDPPQGETRFARVDGGFGFANELMEFVRRDFEFCLGGACYPEGHVEAPSKEEDLKNLRRKVESGAEFLITQLFFDNRHYFDFVDRARAEGIDVPIMAGIMPIQNVEQIKRFTKMCGATIPDYLLQELERRADEPQRVHELGVAHATIQCLGLLQGGAPGIHFYTLNKSTATRQILTAIRGNARI